MKVLSFSRFINEALDTSKKTKVIVPSHEELSELPWFKRLSMMYSGDIEWITGKVAYRNGTRALRIEGRPQHFSNNDYLFYPFKGTILRDDGRIYKRDVKYNDIKDWNTNIGHVYMRELHYIIGSMSIGNAAKLISNKEIGKLLELANNSAEKYPGLIPSILDAVGIKLTEEELAQMKVLASIGLAEDIPKIFNIKD